MLPKALLPRRARLSELSEDYALERVPEGYRKSTRDIVLILLGMSTSFYFFIIGGLTVLMLGFTKGLIAMLIAMAMNGLFALLGGYIGYRERLTADLSSRAYGFGKIGSAVTSGIYAFVLIGFLAIESSMVAQALSSVVHLPMPAIHALLTCFWALLAVLGVSQLVWVNRIGLPLFIGLLAAFFSWALVNGYGISIGRLISSPGGLIPGSPGVALTIAMATPGAAIITADYTRFVKSKKGVLAVGLAFVVPAFLVVPLIGALLAIAFRSEMPGIYFVSTAGALGVALTFLAQLKIQGFNVYSASLALSNLGAMGFKFAPGRLFWVVIASLVAGLFVLPDILGGIHRFLEVAGVISSAWGTILLTDYYFIKGVLGLAPQHTTALENIRFVNPIGVFSLAVSSLAALLLRPVFPVTAFVAIPLSFVCYSVGTIVTKGVYTKERAVQPVSEVREVFELEE